MLNQFTYVNSVFVYNDLMCVGTMSLVAIEAYHDKNAIVQIKVQWRSILQFNL